MVLDRLTWSPTRNVTPCRSGAVAEPAAPWGAAAAGSSLVGPHALSARGATAASTATVVVVRRWTRDMVVLLRGVGSAVSRARRRRRARRGDGGGARRTR